jgi:hypothetical protein
MSSPIKGGSCSAIRSRFNALDYFVALHLVVRDQEVEGSNPFAPTTPNFPFIGLRNFLCFNLRFFLWTNVDQLKAKADFFSPFLPKRYVVFESKSPPPLPPRVPSSTVRGLSECRFF